MANTQTENKTIHHHLATASKVAAVLSVIAFLSVLILAAWILVEKRNSTKAVDTVVPTVSANTNSTPEEIATAYRSAVNDILDGFAFDSSAGAEERLNKVLELRVPGDLKTVHLDIVLALKDAQTGKYTEAQQRIENLKQNYAWMTF